MRTAEDKTLKPSKGQKCTQKRQHPPLPHKNVQIIGRKQLSRNYNAENNSLLSTHAHSHAPLPRAAHTVASRKPHQHEPISLLHNETRRPSLYIGVKRMCARQYGLEKANYLRPIERARESEREMGTTKNGRERSATAGHAVCVTRRVVDDAAARVHERSSARAPHDAHSVSGLHHLSAQPTSEISNDVRTALGSTSLSHKIFLDSERT